MRIEPGASTAAIAVNLGDGPVESYCLDGQMTSWDVAKVAGVTRKEAKRAIDAYCAAVEGAVANPDGAMMTFDAREMPDPSTVNRAQLATYVARKIGLGRFGLKQRIAERAKAKPAKPKEKRVSTMQHPWKDGRHGRAMKTQEGGAVLATLSCSRCLATDQIRFRQLCGSDDMDRKFAQKGWAVDPAKCPEHNRRNHQPRKDNKMPDSATKFASPTPAAIAAQAKMFGLLQTHFDPDTGTYGGGYSDAKIAEECRLSVDLVAGVRTQAFGELKVPNEVAQLVADMDALEQLLTEVVAPIQTELATLKNRVRECCKKFGG